MANDNKMVNGVLTPMTDEEQAWKDENDRKFLADIPKMEAQAKIEKLERSITIRRIRDTYDPDADKKASAIKFITDIEAEIAVERAKL